MRKLREKMLILTLQESYSNYPKSHIFFTNYFSVTHIFRFAGFQQRSDRTLEIAIWKKYEKKKKYEK